MTGISVSLTQSTSESQWHTEGGLSFGTNSATIHISGNDQEQLQLIRASARKLSSLAKSVILTGNWSLEQQWAFATSYDDALHSVTCQWADTQDRERLEHLWNAHQFTCDLVNGTPEDISPETLARKVTHWLSGLSEHVSHNTIIGEDLQHAGWHGIYQVGRGSERPPVLLEIDFNPTQDPDAPVSTALVGKGITFDSGGYSIKSSEGMLAMKCDMGGAATVTGALGLAIMQGLNKRTKLFLCCAENLISGHAYKLGDIITYKNGTTVEIVNTDAEGRLVLADGLMAATESGAKQIIDAATLTGAAIVAVGGEYNALFSMDTEAREIALNVAATVNEPTWALPLEKWHQKQCPSAFADTANSRPVKGGGGGGASNAAGFLSRFVREDGKGWLHFDLAAAYNQSATKYRSVGATAQGLRTIAALTME